MGQEIEKLHHDNQELQNFRKKLREETLILKHWFDNELFQKDHFKTGIELEAWLVDENMRPNPIASDFLHKLNHPSVVPEIALFNFEINSDPFILSGKTLNDLENHMQALWSQCENAAQEVQAIPLLMGTLATLRPSMLELKYITPNNRYIAMNEEVLRFRHGKPLMLRLEGEDQLHLNMDSVIAECAATSLQIHIGVSQAMAARYYNASVIASAFVTAISANSPYLFGLELWDESRIMVFEQAVEMDSYRTKDGAMLKRVTLGDNYVRESLFELFLENLDGHPILLPSLRESEPSELAHLRLHNGTIWRWNRPIIGVNKEGSPHLRIEQRAPSAGPTIKDSVANTAFYLGLVDYLAQMEIPPENLISFASAKENFYEAAKLSFDADVKWVDGKTHNIQKLILDELLPAIKTSLMRRAFDQQQISYYVDEVLHARVVSGLNGARWQKAWIHTHGKRFQEMMEAYRLNQKSGLPVHQWSVD
jgi:hypothetical protein